MPHEALFTLKEGEFVSHTELKRVPVVFGAPAITEFRQCVRDVVVRGSLGTNVGATRKELGVNVQQFREGVPGLKLQTVAHALLRFHNERIIVGTDAVRTVVEASVKAVGTDRSQRAIVTVAVYPIVKLEHGQMAAQRALVLRAEEQSAKELPFHTQVEVLAGRIVHVNVHSADRHALPWIGNRAVRTGRVIPCANGGRTRVEDGVAGVSIEVDQGIKGRVPGAVGPDVVEDTVIEDAVTAADRHFAFAK